MKCAPVGLKFHGYEMFQSAPDTGSKMQRWLLRSPVKWNTQKADYVFSYGGKITAIIESLGVKREKIFEIPTGIDSTWIKTAPQKQQSETRNFLFIGRYERRKGIEELNEVLKKLIPQRDFNFHLVGPIPPTKRIRSNKIFYHGPITESQKLQSIIDTCQVLVTPSHSEGMPNVIMEGMARGLAIIATDVGAVSMLVNESNGWLIEAQNISHLTSAINAAIDLPVDDLKQMQFSSLEKVKEFTWESVAEKVEQAIRQILN